MIQHARTACFACAAILTALAVGCAEDARDRFGRTYYIDGAGNWGFGVSEMRDGLVAAGYPGSVRNWRWSWTLNPALDQTVGRPIARLSGSDLGKEITQYKAKYPQNEVNIIALSAGTGVAVWACESVEPPAKVHSLVLLGSSISSTYDMRKALANISGKVYVYVSGHDQILSGPVRTLGTIDGSFDEPAGLVGLRAPPGSRDRIVNIKWNSRYERYGWTGSHTDCTSEPFVRYVLAAHVLPATHEAGPVVHDDEAGALAAECAGSGG